MDPISTFVFLDMDATGHLEDDPDVIKLSMVAVKREKLLETQRAGSKRKKNPPLYSSNDEVCLTGKDVETSCDIKDAILNFVSTLNQPVCLIAHFGFGFHFPILKRGFSCFSEKELYSHIMCADSMAAFYDILDENPMKTKDDRRLYGAFPWQRDHRDRESYKLQDVYERVLERKPVGFKGNATKRTKALIDIAKRIADEFVPWVDENNFPLTNVRAR